jgi:cobalt-zinc-cadmium efflux system outer membrane protein
VKSCSAIAWLLLPAAALGGRPCMAEQMQVSSVVFRPEQPPPIPAVRSTLRLRSPSVPTAQAAPEVGGSRMPSPRVPAAVPTLTLHNLEQIALQWNPTLVQAAMAVRAAQGGYLQAGLYPNPGIGYAGGDMGLERTSGQQGVVFGQEIVTAGKLRLGRAVAGHEVRQARYAFEAQRRRVLNDVRTGYYEVLLAQRMIDVNRELVRIGQESAKVTEQLKAAQEVSQADVLQAQVEAELAALRLYEAGTRHQAAWRRLAGLLGRPQMGPAPLAGDIDAELPEFDWHETLTRLWMQSPELAQARAGVERARCEVTLQCAQRVPNLEFEMWVKHDATTAEDLADVSVGFPLPLWDRNQGNITRAYAQLTAARHEVRRVELDLRDRLAVAFEQYANARHKVETYRKIVLPGAEKSREMIRIGYREGEFGYLMLLTVQRTYFGVSLDYLESLGQLWASKVEIEGLLLGGGLQGQE